MWLQLTNVTTFNQLECFITAPSIYVVLKLAPDMIWIVTYLIKTLNLITIHPNFLPKIHISLLWLSKGCKRSYPVRFEICQIFPLSIKAFYARFTKTTKLGVKRGYLSSQSVTPLTRLLRIMSLFILSVLDSSKSSICFSCR